MAKSSAALRPNPRQKDPVTEDDGSDVQSDDPITEDPTGSDPITERGRDQDPIPEDRGSAVDHADDDPVTRERVAEDVGGRGSD
jgi:hypothetical protein